MDKNYYKGYMKAKKASIKKHKKHIRNIIKHAHPLNFFGIRFYEPCPKDLKRIKNHRYLINKLKRDIKNMKEYYNNMKQDTELQKKLQKEWNRFKKIMNTPLEKVKQKDLEWAVNQDRFNSINSKGFFEQEIERRKNHD